MKASPWADLSRCARDTIAEVTESVSLFLLEQFAEYLDLVGLPPFDGFREEHFNFFDAPAGDRSRATQAEIKARLHRLWGPSAKP